MQARLERIGGGIARLFRRVDPALKPEPPQAELFWERAQGIMERHNGIDVIADAANRFRDKYGGSVVVEERIRDPRVGENDWYGVSVRFEFGRRGDTSSLISRRISICGTPDGVVEIDYSQNMAQGRFAPGVPAFDRFLEERKSQGFSKSPTIAEQVRYLIDHDREMIGYEADHRMEDGAANGKFWQAIPGEWDDAEQVLPNSPDSEPVNNGILQGLLSKLAKEHMHDPTFGVDRFTLRNPNGTFQTVFLAGKYVGISFAAQVRDKGMIEVVSPYETIQGLHDRKGIIGWTGTTIHVKASVDSPLQQKIDARRNAGQQLEKYFPNNVRVSVENCPLIQGKEVVRKVRV